MNKYNFLLILLFSPLMFVSCAGYQIGNDTLYNTSIKTVYVPMVQSTSFRRHLGERLTEAIVKEIELRTPYKVVRDNSADSVLNVELVDYNQNIAIIDKWGGPRQEGMYMSVKVNLVDRKTLISENSTEFSLANEDWQVLGQGDLIAAAGQSTSTQQQQAIDRIAKNVVNVMEKKW